jgi:hypothetical protein
MRCLAVAAVTALARLAAAFAAVFVVAVFDASLGEALVVLLALAEAFETAFLEEA